MKYAMCNVHINDNYSKYFVYNDSNFILFHCDFTCDLLYNITSADVIFLVLSVVTININLAVYRRGCGVGKTFRYTSFDVI